MKQMQNQTQEGISENPLPKKRTLEDLKNVLRAHEYENYSQLVAETIDLDAFMERLKERRHQMDAFSASHTFTSEAFFRPFDVIEPVKIRK